MEGRRSGGGRKETRDKGQEGTGTIHGIVPPSIVTPCILHFAVWLVGSPALPFLLYTYHSSSTHSPAYREPTFLLSHCNLFVVVLSYLSHSTHFVLPLLLLCRHFIAFCLFDIQFFGFQTIAALPFWTYVHEDRQKKTELILQVRPDGTNRQQLEHRDMSLGHISFNGLP